MRRQDTSRPTCARTQLPPCSRQVDHVVASSSAMRSAMTRLEKLARIGAHTVVIEGESGTGKTWLAKRFHALSPRADGPFVSVSLAALTESLVCSELFGHEAGAYTDARRTRTGYFVSANQGTLFLDEIGKASSSVQQAVLQAIEYGVIRPVGADREVQVDVRVLAATNVSLESLVADGRFLADLFARIGLLRVHLPPL